MKPFAEKSVIYTERFNKLYILQNMKTLNSFNSIIEFQDYFRTEERCWKYLSKILWEKGKPVCPHCGSVDNAYQFDGTFRFKCADCKKQFKVTTGTMFEGTHLKLRTWFTAIYISCYHSKGISSVNLAKWLRITQKTSWFLLHRIRKAQKENLLPFTETTEIDESYFGGKGTGKRGRGASNKTPVLGIVERGGKVILEPVADVTAKILEEKILSRIADETHVITDKFGSYNNLKYVYDHETIDHSFEYVNGEIHTNTIEGVWGLFKRALYGIYHNVSKKHLTTYCVEFAYRYNTRTLNAQSKFDGILNNVFGKRIRYAELIAH